MKETTSEKKPKKDSKQEAFGLYQMVKKNNEKTLFSSHFPVGRFFRIYFQKTIEKYTVKKPRSPGNKRIAKNKRENNFRE
jgi:hypothetical protein